MARTTSKGVPSSPDISGLLKEQFTERGLKRLISDQAMEEMWVLGVKRQISFAVKSTRQGPKKKPKILKSVNAEIRELICTRSAKYAAVRRMLATKQFKASQQALAIMIAGAVATYVGLSVAVILPFVAMTLIAFVTVTKNVYCAQFHSKKKRKTR